MISRYPSSLVSRIFLIAFSNYLKQLNKQPSRDVLRKRKSKNFAKFTEKHCFIENKFSKPPYVCFCSIVKSRFFHGNSYSHFYLKKSVMLSPRFDFSFICVLEVTKTKAPFSSTYFLVLLSL